MKTSHRLFVALCIFVVNLPSQTKLSPSPVTAIRTNEQISIDGELTEETWKNPAYTEFTQREPIQGESPTEKTDAWIAYDDEALYVAAMLHDEHADSVVARLVRRDFVYGDPSDGFLIYIDPYHDKMTGNLFYVSAAGTKADGLVENDGRFELSWDAVWEGVAKLHPNGYVVEMKIPFSQLRFKENARQVWGVNLERYIGRKNETDMIVYTPRNESGFVSRFPDLVGLEGITPPSRLEVMPYVTGKAEFIGPNRNDPFDQDERYFPGGGLDAKVGLTGSLTLDATINPDFGQVEVDPAVVNLTDVETSFEEKRPFFTEGVSIFRFGRGGTNNNWTFGGWNDPSMFYSRRIGRTPQRPGFSLPYFDFADFPHGARILGAGKISGRIGDDWKVGMIHSLTNKEFADIDSAGHRGRVEMEPQTYYGIFRAQRDYERGKHGVGILTTYSHRFFDDEILEDYINSNALVTAADGWYSLDEERTYVLKGWGGISHVRGDTNRIGALQRSSGHYFQRPDVSHISVDNSRTSMTGYAGRLMLDKQRGQWTLNAAVGVIDPYFESNDLGFMSFSDIINTHIVTGYRWNDPTEYYRNIGILGATFIGTDFGGNKTAHGIWTDVYMNLLNYYGGEFRFQYNFESYNARLTRGGPLTLTPAGRSFELDLYSDNRQWWVAYGGVELSSGRGTDHFFAYGNVELKLTPTFTFSIGPSFGNDIFQAQFIRSVADQSATATYGRRYIFAHLVQKEIAANIRLNWILSPELSFQIYAQPYIASGGYRDFKELSAPRTFNFRIFGTGGSTITSNTNSNGEITDYELDPDGSGTNPIPLSNPNFNYRSLRGNAVLRWEYMPGSVLFLVWTQSREDVERMADFRFNHSIDRVVNIKPDNIFLLKISYWLGV